MKELRRGERLGLKQEGSEMGSAGAPPPLVGHPAGGGGGPDKVMLQDVCVCVTG